MEHRYNQRTSSDAKIFIYERSTPVAIGRCKNLSRYGMFVETDHAVYLHQPLEVEIIRGRNRSESKTQRMKCYVVHMCDNGFGVEMREEELNLFSAIASSRALSDIADDMIVVPRAQMAGQF